jgi:hypothetical protein
MDWTWTGTVVGFLVGTATGAAGQYFAVHFTDERRAKRMHRAAEVLFWETAQLMPTLISEMRNDFGKSELRHVREVILLPNERVAFASRQRRFVYFETDHEDLLGLASLLESRGYAIDVTTGKMPIFRLSDSFVESVRAITEQSWHEYIGPAGP